MNNIAELVERLKLKADKLEAEDYSAFFADELASEFRLAVAAIEHLSTTIAEKDAAQVSAENYEAAVKGRQDFRAAYRRELNKVRAYADWNDAELAAISLIATEQDLSTMAVMRQSLRHYQQMHERLKAGETVTWSGDEQRMREFAGPLSQPPSGAKS